MSNFGDTIRKQIKALESQLLKRTVQKVNNRALELAASRMNNSRPIWESGINIVYQSHNQAVFEIKGELAEMFEKGFGVGALGDLIMKGNRAMVNKADGKDYVDVPLKSATNSVQLTSQFEMKKFKFSDLNKPGGIREEFREVAQALKKNKKGIVANQPAGDSLFISFRRTTKENAGQFPKQPVKGANIIEQLRTELPRIIEQAKKEMLGSITPP